MNQSIKTLFELAGGILGVSVGVGIAAFVKERVDEKNEKPSNHHQGIYEQYVKRPLDATLATGATLVFSPILAGTAVLVKCKLGSPVLFTQERPGKDEKIFKLYKFRTMTDERDANGELLPDEVRLTSFGKALRSSSIDELPELFNIIKGNMAVVGPRPLAVQYLPYYTRKERHRHDVRPGLTGLAQINGRNTVNWEERFEYDLHYINNINFIGDTRIILSTLIVSVKKTGITVRKSDGSSDFDNYRREQWGV